MKCQEMDRMVYTDQLIESHPEYSEYKKELIEVFTGASDRQQCNLDYDEDGMKNGHFFDGD